MVPRKRAGKREMCPMCNFKVEVPTPISVPAVARPLPPPPPPPVVEAPPPEPASLESLPSLPPRVTGKQIVRRVGIVVGVLAALFGLWYWAMTTPAVYRHLPAILHRPSADIPPRPPGALSPADFDSSL
jgi:hypothetical protein